MKANELKATDLMVGDWVMNANGKPMQVKRIVFGHFACAENGGANCWEYNNNFKPIPLTPEILEKNGFENQGFRHHDEYDGINDRVVLSNYKDYMNSANEWYVRIDSEDYCSIARCELTYVHELQHILRLCKIDKEIVV